METVIAEKFVTNAKGKKISVILPYKKYRKLLEDLHDLAVIAERRDEKPVSLEAMREKLQKDGLL
jgi:hypothetical protein